MDLEFHNGRRATLSDVMAEHRQPCSKQTGVLVRRANHDRVATFASRDVRHTNPTIADPPADNVPEGVVVDIAGRSRWKWRGGYCDRRRDEQSVNVLSLGPSRRAQVPRLGARSERGSREKRVIWRALCATIDADRRGSSG